MVSINRTEHFVTLFDSKFLPMGLCLHSSLMQHASPSHLWILCMDAEVEDQLSQLALPCVSLVSLSAVETEGLLAVKNGRTKGEYCWTLTPFAPQFVFERDPTVQRATYLDADLFFFDDPQILLDEFDASGKHVLITDHTYAPEYDQTAASGRFCVQFMTFRNTPEGVGVLQWWQDRCLEWCFNRIEDGKFGDQKYLDDWPLRFADEVHVLQQVEKALAPWNLSRFYKSGNAAAKPVFYHFHGLRIVDHDKVVLFSGYKLSGLCGAIYDDYLHALRRAINLMTLHRIALPTLPPANLPLQFLRTLKARITGRTRSVSIQPQG